MSNDDWESNVERFEGLAKIWYKKARDLESAGERAATDAFANPSFDDDEGFATDAFANPSFDDDDALKLVAAAEEEAVSYTHLTLPTKA